MIDYKDEGYWKFVEEFVEELRTATYWFNNDGKPLKKWRLFETRKEAVDAAWSAVWDAAWIAAWDAAWSAAWDAERDAATDAARDAASNEAGDVASNAASNAAWDAGLFARMLVCLDLPMKMKHLDHVNDRMRVWRKGYGLLCDINGELYVYKKP